MICSLCLNRFFFLNNRFFLVMNYADVALGLFKFETPDLKLFSK